MRKTFLLFFYLPVFVLAQQRVTNYEPLKRDSLRIGAGENDFLPFIQSGFTLNLPKTELIKGVLIFLEDSGYDNKNNSAKQLYKYADKSGFAVLSISTEIPFDFYFSPESLSQTDRLINDVFSEYNLPNTNVFFLGASLVGHRALKYIEYTQKVKTGFQLNIKGLVICNFTMDWIRKWKQHERDIKINRIDLWEPRFINYMLESNLKGTPETNLEAYNDFSTYSYYDEVNRNIKFYTSTAILAYIDPRIEHRLKRYYRTLYENNAIDMVGFLAELELAGNTNTKLIVLDSSENFESVKTAQSSWDKIDKKDLMNWILNQSE